MKLYFLAALVAFALSFAFSWILIPILRKLKAGQNILSYVKEHKNKGGTPTMGGIAFLLAALLSTAFFVKERDKTLIVCLVIGLSYMLVGFLDDFLKKKHKENLGLRARQKLLFQLAIALLVGVYCIRIEATQLHIPFLRRSVNIGAWMLPLSAFVFIATVNAVNLTDGLDGLAAGTSVPFFAVFGGIILLQSGGDGMACLCFCLVGALLAYLLFNVSPASVFMRDTGSLGLGGFASAVAVLSGNALYLVIVGACFVFSVISVLLQVIYYKATGGKRIFLMAPAHHHFQMKGYSESRISYAYFIITLILGMVCLISLL